MKNNFLYYNTVHGSAVSLEHVPYPRLFCLLFMPWYSTVQVSHCYEILEEADCGIKTVILGMIPV